MLGYFRMRAKNSGGNALWVRLLLAFTLVAFAQASYVTQTHIHALDWQTSRSAASPNGHKNPTPDDPAHCPLCQEYLIAGVYVAPGPVLLPLPLQVAVHIPQLVHDLLFVAVLSHAWYGRGPPLH